MTLARLALFAACVAACSSESSPEADSGSEPAPPFDAEVCEARPDFEGFALVPEAAPIFDFEDESCGEQATSILLINSSDDAVRVEAVGVTKAELDSDSPSASSVAFFAKAESLPRVLEPQESLAIAIEFEAGAPDVTATSQLVIVTSDGCQVFEPPLQGVSLAKDTGGAYSPLALDFGVLQPSETSDDLEVEFTFLPKRPPTPLHLTIRGTSPDDVFEVVEEFDGDITKPCQRATARVRMLATANAGPVDGTLYYETVTSAGSGVGVIALRGLVRE